MVVGYYSPQLVRGYMMELRQQPPPKLTVPVATLMMEKHGVVLALCPKCKTNNMETVATYRRGVLCAIVASKSDYEPSIAAKNKDSPNP
jgi:hypothetical protein